MFFSGKIFSLRWLTSFYNLGKEKLDKLVINRYHSLSVTEIKDLLFNKKWMSKLDEDVVDSLEQVINSLASKVVLIAKRYEKTLNEIEKENNLSKDKVKKALERMGYKW